MRPKMFATIIAEMRVEIAVKASSAVVAATTSEILKSIAE